MKFSVKDKLSGIFSVETRENKIKRLETERQLLLPFFRLVSEGLLDKCVDKEIHNIRRELESAIRKTSDLQQKSDHFASITTLDTLHNRLLSKYEQFRKIEQTLEQLTAKGD